MNTDQWADDLLKKSTDLTSGLNRLLPSLGETAVSHFQQNFQRGGFVDGGPQMWPKSKRTDPSSPWYGFEYRGERRESTAVKLDRGKGRYVRDDRRQKKLNFSQAATSRPTLVGRTGELRDSITYRTVEAEREIVISTDKPYAQIHNEGGEGKVFGKHPFTMPRRQFIGPSQELDEKILSKLKKNVDAIIEVKKH